MNATILGRMYWKEFRTQRDLWLAIVGICSVMMVLLSLFLSERDQLDVDALFAIGMTASVFYVLASASILYASEHEQGTKTWLGVLPLKPSELMLPKVAWVVSSTLAAIATFWVVAQLFGRGGPSPNAPNEGGMLAYTSLLVLILTCGMLGSQLSRNVLKAIGLVFVLLVGIYVLVSSLPFNGLQRLSQSTPLVAIAIILVAPLGVSIFLNHRWLRESSFTWQWSISLGKLFTLDQALALPLETSPVERSWRRQLWLEWRNARAWMLGIGLSSVFLLLLLHPGAEERRSFAESFFSIVACLVPLLCGVASCRGEQSGQRFLFQGNRGISAGQVLWAKHLVWMSFGVILVFGLGWGSISQMRYEVPGHGGSYSSSLIPVPIRSQELSNAFRSSLVPGIQLIAVISLLNYAIGHFCSLLFSKPIFALSLAVFASIFGVTLAILGYSYGVPLYVLAIVPALSLFFLTLYRGRDWIIARSDRKGWARFFGWSLLCLWTVISLFAGWRVAEVRWMGIAENKDVFQLRYLYPALCAGLILCCALGIALFDFVRRNSKKRLSYSRWFTPLCVLGIFLVGHNSLIALGLKVHSMQNQAGLSEMGEVIRAMSIPSNGSKPDLYLLARDRIKTPIPVTESETEVRISLIEPARVSNQRDTTRKVFLWKTWDEVSAEQRDWLANNGEAIEMFERADGAGDFDRFTILNDSPDGVLVYQSESFLDTDAKLMNLIRIKALQLEGSGNLEEAWEYHLKLIRLVKLALVYALPHERSKIQNWAKIVLFEGDLWRWQARKDQTPELLSRAVTELTIELNSWPGLARSYAIAGGITWEWIRNPPENFRQSSLGYFLPGWERERAMSVVEDITRVNIDLARAVDQDWLVNEVDAYDRFKRLSMSTPEYTVERFKDWLLQNRVGFSSELNVPPLATRSFDPYDNWRNPVRDYPWNLTQTTLILSQVPLGLDFYIALHEPPEPFLSDELEFRIATLDWLANAAIYCYRAEMHQFPQQLGDLQESPAAVELLQSTIKLNRNYPRYYSYRLNQAMLASSVSWKDSQELFDFPEIHNRIWPQAEYQLDIAEETPLSAPQPTQETP